MKAELEVGSRGQFDVFVGGEVVASKQNPRGAIGPSGFPDEEDAVIAVEEALGSRE